MKFNSIGALEWVTQLGATTKADGGDNSGGDYCRGVAVDGDGNVIVQVEHGEDWEKQMQVVMMLLL